MVKDVMNFITQSDPEVGKAIEAEYARQKRNIELIASENIVSEAVMMAMGTVLTNKYAEGFPSKRYYGGCECVDVVENIAIERAKKLFGADHACVQPHSGASANLAVYFALIKPGDTVLGLNLAHGGHLTHGSPVNISGQYFHQVPYSLNDETEMIDYDEVYRIAQECKPKMILAGASAYPRKIDFAKFREIADSVGAFFMVDMAHIAGLVAAGVHESPVPYADVVTTTTHKTLRGPRGGMILCKNEITKKNIETGEMETINLAKKIDSAVFPGTQGGPLEHIIAAKAVCLGEALKPEFRAYGRQVAANAGVLAEKLIDLYYNTPERSKGKTIQISISCATFVPKPFTPFQWAPMCKAEEYMRRAHLVNDEFKEQLNRKSLKYNWHDAKVTVLEGIMARGDRKISKAIEEAYRLGCLFDSWTESFHNELWMQAFENTGVDIDFYNLRERGEDELFPWDFIDAGVTKDFLKREWANAQAETVTPNCRMRCSGCGVRKYGGGVCFEERA